MNLRLNDLRNFVEVANCRTMREGAEKLQITQPALSESIKRLEKDLGEMLFYRSRAGTTLTPSGREIFRKSQLAINSLDDLATGKKRSGRLITIGCHAMVGSYFLPELFRCVLDKSTVRLKLRHDLSRNIQLEIQQGKIDVGVVVNPVPSPDLVIRTIATDEVLVWHRTGALRQDIVFCNLSLNQTHLMLKKWKDHPTEIVDIDGLDLIARITNSGLGLGIIPRRTVDVLNFTQLKPVTGSPTFKDTFSLVYRPEFGKNDEERYLLEKLKRSFE